MNVRRISGRVFVLIGLVALGGLGAWRVYSLARGPVGGTSNSMMVIAPYWHSGTWVFDDPAAGLKREPFVGGVPEMIDALVKDIPNARNGFRLLFSASEFPGYHKKLTWLRGDSGGNYYRLDDPPMEGWICPALFKYYQSAPKEIYVRAEPLERNASAEEASPATKEKPVTSSIESTAARLIAVESLLGTSEPLLGCSDEEIRSLEESCSISLPECYREFLSRMGHQAGRLFRGVDSEYSRLIELQQAAKELLSESDCSFALPSDAFVFSMSQGCNMWFFYTAGRHPDPPVYFWQFDYELPKKLFSSFSEYLLDYVVLIESNAARIVRSR